MPNIGHPVRPGAVAQPPPRDECVPDTRPLIVGIGGTARPTSSTELALETALAAAREGGARTKLFGGAILSQLPLYLTETPDDCEAAREFVETVRAADGVIIASPSYHGTISGLVKNAIDYLEATATDRRVYLDNLPVGLIATAFGWQGAGSTLAALRSVVHALRGWPTPFGAAINVSGGLSLSGADCDAAATEQLGRVGEQVLAAIMSARHRA